MPQVFQVQQIARPAYYDRQPFATTCAWDVSVAPHGTTTRASLQVSANEAAFIELGFLRNIRVTAAGTLGQSSTLVFYTPLGEAAQLVLVNYFNDNTLLVNYQQVLQQLGYMREGDLLEVKTTDTGVGGTVAYQGAIKGTIFLY